jgi:hypothetical protein
MEDVYFMAVWSILRPCGMFCGYLGYLAAIWNILWLFWYIFFRFGMFYQDIWQPCFHLRKVVAEVSCAIKILGHNFQFKEERDYRKER